MARWLSFPNILVSWRSQCLLIVAIEGDLADLSETPLVEQCHRLLDRRAHLVGAGMVGREAEFFSFGDESRIADDLRQGLLQQIDTVRRRARRDHHQAAEAGDTGAPVDQARLRRSELRSL